MMQGIHPTEIAAIKQDPSGAHLVPSPPKQPLECWGAPKEALEKYRKRVRELDELGQKKPDMVACRELKGLVGERQHGELRGVPGGLWLKSRGEAAITGIHQTIPRGIDFVKGEPCYAVCISGGYADDDDASDRYSGGKIFYTGEGGRGKNGKQERDQSDSSPGNQALLRSIDSQDTIRVIRGNAKAGYYYLGLYRCTSYTYDPGVHGFKVFKFTLVPIIENQSPLGRSIPLDSKWSKQSSKKINPLRAKVEDYPESPLSKKRRLAKAAASKLKPLRTSFTMPKQAPLENVYAPQPPQPAPVFYHDRMGKQEATAGAECGEMPQRHRVVKREEGSIPRKTKAPCRGSLIGHQEEIVLGDQSHSNFTVTGAMAQTVRKDPRLFGSR